MSSKIRNLPFKAILIQVETYDTRSVDDVIEGMFMLGHNTGAIVTCGINGVELSTSYFCNAKLLKDFYLLKLEEMNHWT